MNFSSKRIISTILTLCMLLSFTPTLVINAENTDDIDLSSEYIYISDIDYLSDSKVGYGSIQKDKNVEGGTISVYLDGVATPFDKGMAAHATSTLYYDLSEYKDYTRFSAYLGIEASKNAGNGVSFVVSVSDDKKTWTDLYTIDTILPGDDAVYVDLELNNANYLRLYSNNLGNATQDHSVYADARLLKSTYDTSQENPAKFDKYSVYDEEILEEYSKLSQDLTLTDSMKQNLLKRTFVRRYGYYTIQRKSQESEGACEAINYIFDNPKVLNYFVLGGVKDRDSGSYSNVLDAWCSLYGEYKDDFSTDMYLKMAVSMSIAYARSLNFWIGSVRNSIPTERYAEFKYLIENGYFDRVDGWSSEQFANLPIELMRLVLNSEINEDEMVWLADLAKDKGGDTPTLNAYHFIEYKAQPDYSYGSAAFPQFYDFDTISTSYAEKWNLDNVFLKTSTSKSPLVSFGTDKHVRLWMMFEAGSVCGGLAGTYEVLHEVHGIPAELINQPGHAATFVYSENANGDGIWSIKNDVSNWKQSQDYNTFYPVNWNARNTTEYGYDGSFLLLAQHALNEYEKYESAMYYKFLIDVFSDADKHSENAKIYEKMLEVQPYNLDAMMGKIDSYIDNPETTISDYMNLAKYIVDEFTYYPLPMLDMLKCIEPYIESDTVNKLEFDTMRRKALEKAASATDNESIQASAVKDVAKKYLGVENEPFSFSFDGENAGKIVLDSSYSGNDVTWCYTLGGRDLLDESINPDKQGIVTVTGDEKALSEDELNAITSDNDICIYIVGANTTIYTIDIKDGVTPTSKTLYANDWENRFIGTTANLEWCENGSDDWKDYDENTVFLGDKTIKARYKAYGTTLSGDENEYVFTTDTDSDECKYVSIRNIELLEYSSQNSNSDAAIHLIDGNMNTRWHNTWSGEANKYYAVEFDNERYITQLEYYPDESGWNGQFKSGEIYTMSENDDEWVLSGSFENLEQTKSVKYITLTTPIKCKKMKIVFTKTYGGSESQQDRFACGRMLNFYENTTMYPIPTETPAPTATLTPTATPDVVPTASPSAMPTETPNVVPTASPSAMPTETPNVVPTASPSAMPTETPNVVPTIAPTSSPSGIFYEKVPTLNDNTLDYSVVNNTASSAYFAVAVYDESGFILKNIEFFEIKPSETLSSTKNPLTLNLGDKDTYKTFLWDDLYRPIY